MELTLTNDQRKYLDKKGYIDANNLKHVYKKSVQDQKLLKEQAARIRNKKK